MTVPKAFVIGHPIHHSRSPLIHGHWLREHGIPGSYERIDVPPAGLPRFLRDLAAAGFVGGNVTLPHKEAVLAHLDRVSDRARRLGAANTIWLEHGLLCGDNTDVLGFVASLEAGAGSRWAQRPAVVIGAGGAARAVVAGLLDRGIPQVGIANRTPAKVAGLIAFDPARVTAIAPDALPQALETAGLLVNTTSLGMTGQPPLALDLAPLPAGAVVTDLVYAPLETPLLAAARRRDLAVVDGLGMLLHQAVPGFERWFGIRPEVTPALRARVVADLAPAAS